MFSLRKNATSVSFKMPTEKDITERIQKEEQNPEFETEKKFQMTGLSKEDEGKFQKLIKTTDNPETIKMIYQSFDPLAHEEKFYEQYLAWANNPLNKKENTTFVSWYSNKVCSIFLGGSESNKLAPFVYYEPRNRVNCFPEHFKNISNVEVSKNIQFTHETFRLLGLQLHEKIAMLFLSVGLILGTGSAVVIATTHGVSGIVKDYKQKSAQKESIDRQIEQLQKQNASYVEQKKAGTMKDEDFVRNVTQNNDNIKSLKESKENL